MIRSWGVVSLTGAAQPWFGSVTTAAMVLAQVKENVILVPVSPADSKKFVAGDRIVIEPGTTSADTLLINSINTTTGILTCASEGNYQTHAHASGVIVMLSIACADVQLQAVDGAAATVWLGTDNTVTAIGGGSAFRQLQKVAAGSVPSEYRMEGSAKYNVGRTSDGWMIGTAADKVAVAAIVL